MIRFDYADLVVLMKQKGLRQRQVAELIGVSENGLSTKLANGKSLKQEEISKLTKLFNIDPENIGRYFFKIKVNENELNG